MSDFHVKIGHAASFTKTVSEYDVYSFAGITGDLAPNHVDKAYMEKSVYGRRIAHGALLVGFMSTACSMAIADARPSNRTPVSVGFDRIRFIKPVFFDDTITVTYTISEIDLERQRSISSVEIVNQDGELVCVGRHILQWVANEPEGD